MRKSDNALSILFRITLSHKYLMALTMLQKINVEMYDDDDDEFTFIPSKRETALNGRRARSDRRAFRSGLPNNDASEI